MGDHDFVLYDHATLYKLIQTGDLISEADDRLICANCLRHISTSYIKFVSDFISQVCLWCAEGIVTTHSVFETAVEATGYVEATECVEVTGYVSPVVIRRPPPPRHHLKFDDMAYKSRLRTIRRRAGVKRLR